MIYLLVVVNGEFQNHYQILQIDEKATANEIKKAYRKMTLQYHPDKQKGKTEEEIEQAKQLFHKVTQAHDVLKDEKLRAQFDEDLEFGLGDEESYYGGGGAYSNLFQQERMERRRKRERNRRYGFFGRMDSITSYIYPLLFIYGLYNAMRNGGFNLASFGDLPRYFGFDPSSSSNMNNNTTKNKPCIGIDITIHNIVKQPDFNGKKGKILSYNPEKKRYVIQFGENGEKKVALKPKNLKPMYILIDHFYMIENLKNSSQYNNKKAKILSYNSETKRYVIQFKYENEMKQLALKKDNIVLCIPGDDNL